MKPDSEIERAVMDGLSLSADLDTPGIAVRAKRVSGVVAVADNMEVHIPSVEERPDHDISRDAIAAINSQLRNSSEKVKVIVMNGWITLEGQVEWQYQRSAAEHAVRIKGVKDVSNMIQLKAGAQPSEIRRKMQDEFGRTAEVDLNRIVFDADGGVVTLKGTMRSWVEREAAERGT